MSCMFGKHKICQRCWKILNKSQIRSKSTGKWTSSAIRSAFIDFFCKQHHHIYVPPSSVIAKKGEGSYFINAGMNQFKPIFLNEVAEGSPLASYRRVANSQKCIRVGGKHNDLEDVGRDLTHHTFFEMLGSWSFGDYFKKEACSMALELLQDVYKLPQMSLYFTYFGGDPKFQLEADFETRDIWLNLGIEKDRVLPFGMNDNFWDMGYTGPCGPCTEIHYDHVGRGAGHLVNADSPEVVEIWNLVFMQYNRENKNAFHFILQQEDQTLVPLPRRHVDTGMGLERMTAVLQNSRSNYDTDLFLPVFNAIHKDCGVPEYSGRVGTEDQEGKDMAYRIIGDHIRMVAFCICEGILPDRLDGHGHKVRTVLHRCIQQAQCLNIQPGYLSCLVDIVVDSLGDAYPELNKGVQRVKDVINDTEASYYKSIEQGNKAFKSFLRKRKHDGPITDTEAQALRDGRFHGFPVHSELLEVLASQHKILFDIKTMERKEDEQETKEVQFSVPNFLATQNIPYTDDSFKYAYQRTGNTYEFPDLTGAKVVGIRSHDVLIDQVHEGEECSVILDKTCFYAECGGQVGDTGTLSSKNGIFKVQDTKLQGHYVEHIGQVKSGSFRVGDQMVAKIDKEPRLGHMRAHTATHLFNNSIRRLTGDARQNGSLVEEDKFLFEIFTTSKLNKQSEVIQLQTEVQEAIKSSLSVTCTCLPLHKAQQLENVVYLQNEVYPNNVNVISVGNETPVSVELCGGTHVHNTADIEDFCIQKLTGVGQGRKEVSCFTGAKAREAQHNGKELVRLMQGLEDKVKEDKDAEEWNGTIKKINKYMNDSFIPMVERDDVFQRIEKIGHVIQEKLGRISVNKIQNDIINAIRESGDKSFIMEETEFKTVRIGKRALSKVNCDKPVLIYNVKKGTLNLILCVPKDCNSKIHEEVCRIAKEMNLKTPKSESLNQKTVVTFNELKCHKGKNTITEFLNCVKEIQETCICQHGDVE